MEAGDGVGGAGLALPSNVPKIAPGTSRTTGNGSRKAKFAQDVAMKNEVKNKIISGEHYVVRIDEGNPLQSPGWKKFGRVWKKKEDGAEVLLPFIQCLNTKCGLVKMFTNGRGGMVAHNCRGNAFALNPPKEATETFHDALHELFVSKLLPMYLVDCPELIAVIQEGINLGSIYGNVDAASLLPSSSTLHIDQ